MFWNDIGYDDLIKKDKYEKVAYDGESEIWYNTTDEFFIIANKFLSKSTPLRYAFEFIREPLLDTETPGIIYNKQNGDAFVLI